MKFSSADSIERPREREVWLCTETSPPEVRLVLEVMDQNEHPFFGKVVYMSLITMRAEHDTLFWWMKKVREEKLCLVSDCEV